MTPNRLINDAEDNLTLSTRYNTDFKTSISKEVSFSLNIYSFFIVGESKTNGTCRQFVESIITINTIGLSYDVFKSDVLPWPKNALELQRATRKRLRNDERR